jgi:hypothetical protein
VVAASPAEAFVSGCHCLCFKNHPTQEGICAGAEDLELTFYLEGVPWPVPMCSACAAATLAAREPERLGS